MTDLDDDSGDLSSSGSVNRRGFLVTTAAAVGAAAVGATTDTKASAALADQVAQRDVDVVVVGGGISGLAAARRLVQAGRSVVVLEANNRTGGRVYDKDLSGAPMEVGGEWVTPEQTHMYALMKEFGIHTFPTHTQGTATVRVNGKVYHPTGTDLKSFPLSAKDTVVALAAVASLAEMVPTVNVAQPWLTPNAPSWDSQTVASWLTNNVPSPVVRDLISVASGGTIGFSASDISLLHYLFVAKSAGGLLQSVSPGKGGVLQDRVNGGPAQIVDKLAAGLGKRVILNAPVRTIDQSGNRVKIYSDKGLFTGAHVIVAMPPMMAGRILYHPALPAKRDQLTQRAPMGWTLKCFATYPTPFWRKQGLSGIVTDISPDSPLVGVFDNTPPVGHPGALYGLMVGTAARKWGPRSPAQRKAAVLDAFAAYFGAEARKPLAYMDFSWAAAPWSRGGAGMGFGPGTWTEYGKVLRRPVGRIHWAGTETADKFWGDMEGGITAANRAVAEIL